MEEVSTPEQIAEYIFSRDPQSPNTVKITSDHATGFEDGFEILLTVLFEGLNMMIDGLDNVGYNDLSDEHFEILQPWVQSMGFTLTYQTKDNDKIGNYYCRVIFKNSQDEGFFTMKNINKNYHFLISSEFDRDNAHTHEDYICVIKGENKSMCLYFNPN